MPRSLSRVPRFAQFAWPAVAGALLFGAAATAQAPKPLPSDKPTTAPGHAVIHGPPAHGPTAGCCDAPGNGGHFILDSICGPANCPCWTPLCCSNLGEGWTDAWIRPPDGSSGAPRQVWLNAADGFFTREFHLFYFWINNIAKQGDAHVGLFQFQTPLSRRLWVGFDLPFVGLDGFGGSADTARFGDLTVTPMVMLSESQDRSLTAGLAIRTPTGTRPTGDDLLLLTPFVALWTDLGSGVSLRSSLGVEVPINDNARSLLPDAVLVGNLALGQTLTCHDAAPFGDFTYYVSLNVRRDLGTANEHTFLSITPGVRTHLGHNWYFLAAYEVPVVGPRGFDQTILAGLVKGW